MPLLTKGNKNRHFLWILVIKPKYYDTLLNKEGRKRFCRTIIFLNSWINALPYSLSKISQKEQVI